MTKVVYDRETCSRCNGSGRYSYNQVNGTRCFGCNGRGKVLSERGAAAKAYADSLLDTTVDGYIADHEGRTAKFDGRTFNRVEVKDTGMQGKNCITGEVYKLNLYSFYKGHKEVCGTYGAGPATVRLVPTKAQVEEIMNYQQNWG